MSLRIIKFILFALTIVLFLSSCTKRIYLNDEVTYSVEEKDENTNNFDNASESNSVFSNEQEFISRLIDYAESLNGSPYKWGGTTPDGFDCSGFIQYIFSHFGVNIPRMPADIAAISVKVEKKDLQSGDIVYFKGSNINSDEIGHIALVTEKTENGFKFIHSTSSKGVIVSDINQFDYWISRYLFATRFKKETILH